MEESRLRNHIPLSAPATREPCDGTESPFRVSMGFTPRWYRDRLGIDFGEAWHLDAAYRRDALMSMRRLLAGLFPDVGCFGPLSGPGAEALCATLSGVMGIMVVLSLYGLLVAYRADGWPDAAGGAHLPREELDRLVRTPLDLARNPAAIAILSQAEEIGRRWATISGYLNYQGCLNVAVKLRGQDFFIDLYDDPDFAHRLLGHIAGTIRDFSAMVQARQRASGFPVDLLSVSNCTVSMISPDQYEEFLLPHDAMLARTRSRFGIHTCNWLIDPYRDSLRKAAPRLGYIDTGIRSDLAALRRDFPEARRAVLYTPGELESKSLDEIGRDLERVARDCGPCDLVLADLETTIPDARVREILAMARQLEPLAAEGAKTE